MTVAKASKISPLDPTAAEAFYRQIYNRFRGAITSGLLKPGDRIPSARALTKELGLARGTIEAAYSLLAAEGYIQARGQAGTIVTPGLKPRAPVASPMPSSNSGVAAAGFRPIRFCRSRWVCLPWMRFPERSGLAWARGVYVPCNHPTWFIPLYMACRYCVLRSPHTSRFRAGSPARHLRYS